MTIRRLFRDMRTTIHEPAPGRLTIPGMPSDVAEWIGAVRLTRGAFEAVEAIQMQDTRSMALRATDQAPPCASLLAVFAYGLARGISGSSDLENRAHMEPALRHLCQGDVPTARALRKFRRGHSAEIEKALTRVLESCWDGCEGQDRLQPALAVEAQSRLRASLQADSLSLD